MKKRRVNNIIFKYEFLLIECLQSNEEIKVKEMVKFICLTDIKGVGSLGWSSVS